MTVNLGPLCWSVAQGSSIPPTPDRLQIETSPLEGDPTASHWTNGAPVGLLGLQADTGRRNRMNGRLVESHAAGFAVAVGQSFGNCPKYIHARRAVFDFRSDSPRISDLEGFTLAARRMVRMADTFFIASSHPSAKGTLEPWAGVDVSHRGGPAGFVRISEEGSLLVPDYKGNFFFNTLGNLQLEPRAGLLFIDFSTGTRAHLACRAVRLVDRPNQLEWPDAQRILELQVKRSVIVEGGLPLRWEVA